MERREITSREDVQELVDTFYTAVRKDELIGPVFEEVAQVNWASHLPRMYAFWETVLLNKAGYKGNPVKKHVDLALKTEMNAVHFERWISLFEQTIDRLFIGKRARVAKERANVMSKIMLYKCSVVSNQNTSVSGTDHSLPLIPK